MDYKKLYKKMFNATTEAIYTLQQAQIECEDMYIESGEKDGEKISKFTVLENESTQE